MPTGPENIVGSARDCPAARHAPCVNDGALAERTVPSLMTVREAKEVP
jgi:hypothetical protein